MITTLFFLQLAAFVLWYITSGKVPQKELPARLIAVAQHRKQCRITGALLVLMAVMLFVVKLGVASGIIAGIAGLMCAGCLVVLLFPFRYVGPITLTLLYVGFLFLEIFI